MSAGRAAPVLLALATACSRATVPGGAAPAGANLETAAIRAGVIDDPATADPTGLYASDNDRLCLVSDDGAFRVGVSVDYGDQQNCRGTATAARSGETLRLSFPAAPDCVFLVRFDGDRIRFPGDLPDGCAALCSGRATLTGLSLDRLSDSPSEAGAMRDVAGRRPCTG